MTGDPTSNIRRLPVPAEGDVMDWYPDEGGPALPGKLTETGYQLPEGLSIGKWLEIGETLRRMEKSVLWWLGDWWNYGDRRYGEMAAQSSKDAVEDTTGYAFQTVKDAGWVAAQMELSRRRDNLAWSYHREVAALEPIDQDALLDLAITRGWKRADLREEAKKRKAAISIEAARVAPIPTPERLPVDLTCDVEDARLMPLADGSVDLIVTSPPYALDKDYEHGDLDAGEWQSFMAEFLREALRVTAPSGRLALNVPLDVTRGGFRAVYAHAVNAAAYAGWTYRSTIVWIDDQLGKSTARGSLDSPAAPHIIAPVEMIALFSKGGWKQTSDRPSTLTHEEWLEWTSGYWRIPGETRPWEGHPAPFPFEIPRRLIRLLSFEGDVVLDPFCGSGTTALAAVQLKRKAIAYDTSEQCVRSTLRRVTQ